MITLTRFISTNTATIGKLAYGDLSWFTVERPWLGNKLSISCIPDGTYNMTRVDSPKFGESRWEISNVSGGRTHILVHSANLPAELEGCVALGKTIYPGLTGVGSSRVAVNEFYDATEGITEEQITIRTEALRG